MKTSRLILGLLSFFAIFFLGYAISILPVNIIVVLLLGFIFAVLTLLDLKIGLFLLIFVVPFTQQLTLAKFGNTPIDIGTDDILILFIAISWFAGLARRKEPLFPKTSLNWPLAAFFVAGIFSFYGVYENFGQGKILISGLYLFKFFEYSIIYFIVISAIDDIKQIKKFLWMFFIAVGVVALLQFIVMIKEGSFSLTSAGPKPREVMIYTKAMYAFVSNAILGAYYAFFLSIILAMMLNLPDGKDKLKVSLFFFSFIISFALFNTFSRSSYLGIIVSIFLLSILKERRLFFGILLLVIFAPIYMQSAVSERIALTLSGEHSALGLDYSSAIRLVLWEKGLQIFLDNIIFGTGFWTTRWILGTEAHSQYVALLVETGIVGFSVFCWLIIRMFKNAVVLMKQANVYFLKALSTGYIAGFAAILVTCFFSETLEAFRMLGPLWFVTGLVTSANRLLAKEKNS